MPNALQEIICENCHASARTSNTRFCSAACHAEFRKAAGIPAKQRIDYAEELVSRVRNLYDAGHTMRETAELTSITVGVLRRLMHRHGIDRRKAAKRDQRGERNHMWRGSGAGYQSLHLRVEAARGKPNFCACCDITDPSLRYEWANLSGRYDDINDYARMCVSCHHKVDAARRAELGRRTSPKRGGGQDA